MTKSWDLVTGRRAVMLTTFRRDGSPIATPVGYGIDGDRLYFMTAADAGKVRRLRHTARVLIAASTLRGRVTGPAQAGTAEAVTGEEARRGRQLITRSNRLAWKLILRGPRADPDSWSVYVVRPTEIAADPPARSRTGSPAADPPGPSTTASAGQTPASPTDVPPNVTPEARRR